MNPCLTLQKTHKILKTLRDTEVTKEREEMDTFISIHNILMHHGAPRVLVDIEKREQLLSDNYT